MTPHEAAGAVRRAAAVHGSGAPAGQPAEQLGKTLAAGRVLPSQAQAIVDVLAQAPASATGSVRREAERTLLAESDRVDAKGLRRLGHRIWELVDPDAADAAEAERLEAIEQRAHDRRRLGFLPTGDGLTLITGRLPDAEAALVRTALDPLAAPMPSTADGPDPRSGGQRQADALIELARRALAGGNLPDEGGERPRLVISVPHTALLRGAQRTGVGRLDDDLRIAPSQVAQAACDCERQALVLDGLRKLPLWMPRRSRLVRGSLRRALVARDGGCAFPACDRPPTWCDGHHIVPWNEGGETSLANCVLLCGYHHRLIHKGHWAVRMANDGHPEVLPPRWIDPARAPIRHRRAPLRM